MIRVIELTTYSNLQLNSVKNLFKNYTYIGIQKQNNNFPQSMNKSITDE